MNESREERFESGPASADVPPFVDTEGLEDLEIPVLDEPWITYVVIAVCSAVCAAINLAPHFSPLGAVMPALAPSAIAIWAGSYWGLLTSAFVHVALWHIFFNMWWAKDFGALLEPTMGRGRYLLFIVGAAVASSGAQLATSDQTGIGFSGVVYAMFGYAMAARHVEPIYKYVVNSSTIKWLLGWLVLCFGLTATGILNVGNAAHTAGFLFGFFTAHAFRVKQFAAPARLALASLAALSILAAVYMPWSETWQIRGDIAEFFAVKEAAEQGDADAQFTYSLYLEGGERPDEAMEWLQKSVDQGHPPAMNHYAWALATDPDDDFRNGQEAVRLAEQACEADGWKTAAFIDTLAAAYAETDRWDEAVKTQELAITKLTEVEEDDRPSFETRLEAYLRQEKVRE